MVSTIEKGRVFGLASLILTLKLSGYYLALKNLLLLQGTPDPKFFDSGP